METGRSPGQRAGLTRAAVLQVARELVSAGGAEALTMRAVARRLEVAPNALYSHVRNKTALLDDVLDELLAAVEAPAPDAPDPVAALVALMTSSYRVLTDHADLVPLYLARQGARGPNAIRLGEVLDVLLVRAGIDPALVVPARRVLIIHAIGAAAFATGGDGDGDPPVPAGESRRSFELSLDWLLTGIVHSTRAGDPGD